MKTDRKIIFNIIYKNRFLILSCAVLIAGTIFGTSMLGFLPENIRENLFDFVSQKPESFISCFLNRFCFPFILLFGIYLAGFSSLGYITSFAAVFINGAFFGFENGLNYMFLGLGCFADNIILYFTATLYFGFILIIMAESSAFSSRQIVSKINNKNQEIPYYNAKNQTVKFITFTIVFVLFSSISTYISVILLP